jgi:hypothetical protein
MLSLPSAMDVGPTLGKRHDLLCSTQEAAA